MAITSDDIDKLAVLARLEFASSEHEQFTEKLASVVAFVDQLADVETDDVTPMAHPLDMHQRLRPDTEDADIDREALQSTTEHTADGLYVVPRVIE
ncbi:MAG: Asp-tRNA(Asn)/Glu-tRNA(Gln) amidotransferase subunit GatC [Pseudomonadota bacterium]